MHRPAISAGLLALAAAASMSCNTRSQPFDQVLTTAPTATTTATAPGAPAPRLGRIDVGSAGAIGPHSGTGTLTLDAPAPEGGVTASLRSSAPSVLSVSPSQVTVASGANTAAFSFVTQSVQADTNVSIIASTPEQTISGTVGVWAVLPSFYSWAGGEVGLVPAGTSVRRTSSTGSSFDARCIRNVVTAVVDATAYDFSAANGQPLRVGVYENVRSGAVPDTTPRMPRFVAGIAPNTCAAIGRLQVRELEYAPDGIVRKLWISFEQWCPGQPGTLRGDIRTAARPNNPWRNQCTMP